MADNTMKIVLGVKLKMFKKTTGLNMNWLYKTE